ncbi:MAG: hypothetical protein ABEJ99_05305 [Candidatus Nanohaloarchaea archaeon]
MTDYFVIDVETVPLDFDAYLEAQEDGNFLNPVDSRIIAAGIRHDGENHIFIGEDEEEILEEFWIKWGGIKKGADEKKVVGFNIKDFDMHMLVGRSLANEIGVMSFTKGDLIDLRESLSCFGWRPKGTLEDYAELAGVETQETESSKIPHMAKDDEIEKIKNHLKADLRITDELFQKSRDLNITKIDKW